MLPTDTRGPVRHEEGDGLSEEETIDLEDVTRLDMLLPLEADGMGASIGELVLARAVEERTVDTTLVGGVEVDDLIACIGQLGLLQQILEDASILDLTDP